MSTENILEIIDVSKSFPGVKALDNIRFSCKKGEIHALIGENGAGKSTLLKIISGMYRPDSGKIIYKGKEVQFHSPAEAKDQGIAMVYQELSILPELTVAQNVYLNEEEKVLDKGKFHLPLIREGKLRKAVSELAAQYGIEVDPYALAKDIPVAKQQMIEILKAMVHDPDLLILDEPTSSLDREEVDKLFEIIRNLQNRGITIIFISHRLEEIFQFAERVTVFKDGKYVGTENTADIDEEKLIRMMVGRDLKDIFPPKVGQSKGETVFKVENINYFRKVRDVSFEIRYGEIVSIAGLQGQGQDELLRVIAGINRESSGSIYIGGKKVDNSSPAKAIKSGIAYAPEDRKVQGLCLFLSIRENIAMASLKDRLKGIFIDEKKEEHVVHENIKTLSIKTPTAEQLSGNLSGGNQQKVVIGKSLAIRPKVLIFNEPTRGIDVEAKQEIYQLLRRLAAEGIAVLMYSSDMLEVIGLSDRVLPMYEGRITAELTGDDINEETIMRAAVGMVKEGA